MKGSKERDRPLKRARPKSSAGSALPCIPSHLKALRQRNKLLYVAELIQFLQTKVCPCHPSSDVGWWCCYEEQMNDLITFLSEPQSSHPQIWSSFRTEVSSQLSLCRQCAITYHKAVNEWELSSEVSEWSHDLIRRRVSELVEWDANRLIPAIEKGVMSSRLSDDPDTLPARTQCREAFLKSLLSLRLCMHEEFCKILGKVFRTRTPARNLEDVAPFIKTHGVIPPGVAALCFHSSKQVRKWAKSIYVSCRKHLSADKKAVELLISKGLRLAVTKGFTTDEGIDSRSVAWAPDFQCLWEGLDTLLTSVPSQELDSMMKRNKKFPITEAFFKSLRKVGQDFLNEECEGLSALLSSLRYVLLTVPFASLFGSCKLTPQELLDAVIKCFKVRSNNSCERRLLLDIMLNIPSASTTRGSSCDSKGLFLKCFGFLEDLECFQQPVSHSARQQNTVNVEDFGKNCDEDILTTGARLLYKFYWHSWPRLPLDNARLADFVTKIVRGIPGRECAWDLLRAVLLTDIFNLMGCIYRPRELEMIANTFFSFRAEMSSTSERRSWAFESAVREICRSQGSLTWVGDMWKNLRKGYHISDESQHSAKERVFDLGLTLDLHLLVGVLDPQRCRDLVQNDVFELSRSHRKDSEWEHSAKDLVAQRVETIHESIVSRIQVMGDVSDHKFVSLKELPFHAAHLLSSSRGEVSIQALLMLQRRCNIQHATCAKPRSRDKLLVHMLHQNKDDSRMLFDGFMSATRITSAQGAAVSLRTYPSFFRWYSMLTSKDCRILRSREIAKGAVGVLLTFLENWKALELMTNDEPFRESICRLFSVIPTIWNALCDIEETSERKSGGKVDNNRNDVSSWVRKVSLKLLTMYDLRDAIARGAWVRMITHESLKLTLKSIDSHDVLIGILGEHESRRGPLTYDQCRRVADAFDLEEASQVLDRWNLHETRRNAKQMTNANNTKNYRETKIDNFFALRLNGTKTMFSAQTRNTSVKKMSEGNDLRVRAAVAQQRHIGFSSTVPVRSNGSLHDLRRDHRHARAELRRAAPTTNGVKTGNCEPAKTRFELLREERIAEKERKKSQVHGDGDGLQVLEMHSEQFRRQEGLDHIQSESANEALATSIDSRRDMELTGFSYPSACRDLPTRCLERIKRDVLMSQDPHGFEIETYTSCPPETFDNVDSYVSYWEPLLIAEFRTGMKKKVDEERFFAEQDKRDQENKGCRAVFEVEGPAEDVGYLHTLSITRHNRGESSMQGQGSVGIAPFDTSSVQVSDILLLEIPGSEVLAYDARKKGSEEVFAIVSTVTRSKKELRLTLHVVFDKLSAPGKGRLVKVSKLLSFATLQRQLDALWSLPKMQDGILWSLLDPLIGWDMKRDLEARDEVVVDHNSSFPLQVIEKMESLGVLNGSQVRAITDVIRSCSCLFASHGGGARSQYTKHNHGSLSLIQGPPGTGKTTTIIALLSALLASRGSNPYRRKAKVLLDGVPEVLRVPAIRVLVCAPSNAAVDELMLRVMNEGLFTASEKRVCPRLVRVGRGTTVESLRALELRYLSKCDNDQLCSKDSAAHTQNNDHRKLLDEVNRQIGELDSDRREMASQLEKSDGCGITPGLSRPEAEKFRELGEKLNILHDKKKLLRSILSHEKEAARKEEASRKRESMKTICHTLASASVVFATLSSSGHEDMKSLGVQFDVVIVDEAGQSCEPEALIPITLGQFVGSAKQRFVHTVLVGDPRQLPATVISSNPRVATAMGRSLFERIGHCDPGVVHLLDTQYRMHPKISSFPSERFYGGLIRNSASVRGKSMHKLWHRDEQNRFGPLTIFDTAQTATKETRSRGGSLSNATEAKLVTEALISMVLLYRSENLLDRIVVLSPYKQQVVLLKRLVSSKAELRDAKVEVSTIDGIQGREKSVVLLSTVRSGHSKDIGFVKDDRRLNVALTRAKHTLMIFGHVEFLSTHSDSWAALMSHCRKHSQVVSLTEQYHGLFPESRSPFSPRFAKEPSHVHNLPDTVDDKQVTERTPDRIGFGGIISTSGAKADVLQEESTRTINFREKGVHVEELPSNEGKSEDLRTRSLGTDHRKQVHCQRKGLRDRVLAKTSTVFGNAQDRSTRSEQKDIAFNSTYPTPKPVRRKLQPAWRLHDGEKRKVDEARSRWRQLGATPQGRQELSVRDLPKTNFKPTRKRPHVDVAVEVQTYPGAPPLQKSSASQDRLATTQRGSGHSSQQPPAGSPPCGGQRSSQLVFQKEPKSRAIKRSARSRNMAPRQEEVLTTPSKRSCPSHGSESLPRLEPPRKVPRLDNERRWRQGGEHRPVTSRGRRYPEQNRDKSYIAHRHALQPQPTFQSRKQTAQRLVTHHQSRNRQSRDKQAHARNQDVKPQSQIKGSRTAPAFSLADTQTKLKGTLDTARKARYRNGTRG